MNEKELNPSEQTESSAETTPRIIVNEYGQTRDPAVVVEEANRTVLLTADETIVFEKDPAIDIVPKNRPRTIYAGMWGRNEILTLGLGIFALLVTILIYFFLVVPSNRELAQHETEAETLRFQQSTANDRYGSIKSTKTHVAKLLSSEEDFELNHLPSAATGRNALYQRLNGLIDAYGLVNTSGPDYAPLETLDQSKEGQTEQERGRARFKSLFPGVYVTMTVEGTYQNLRRFIREIETGQEFVVVSGVQLEPSDNEKQSSRPNLPQGPASTTIAGVNARPGNPQSPNPQMGPIADVRTQGQKGKTHGELVSLHLEMAAYFRRPGFVPSASQ